MLNGMGVITPASIPLLAHHGEQRGHDHRRDGCGLTPEGSPQGSTQMPLVSSRDAMPWVGPTALSTCVGYVGTRAHAHPRHDGMQPASSLGTAVQVFGRYIIMPHSYERPPPTA
jgi:hypothetical protein